MPRIAVCIWALSAGLILAAARGDLWLDEIWSILLAAEAASPEDIFFKFHYDNNHVLNTFYQYLIGKQDLLYLHRLPAIAAGIGSIWLVGMIAGKRGAAERLFATLLAGTSYPLILYFSESRGYAPAIFCALLCFALLQEQPPRLSAGRVVVFWIASIVGILSHATFVMVLAALLCLSVVQLFSQRRFTRLGGLSLGVYFSLPVIFLAAFYAVFLRHIVFGGGPVYAKWQVVCRAASLTLGFPEGTVWGTLALGCVVAVTAAGTLHLYREGSAQSLFFPVVLFVAPSLLIVALRPTYLYFRYFIVCIPFFCILLGYVSAALFRSSGNTGRWLIIAAMLLFAWAQAQRIVPLVLLGRGSYRAAIQHITSHSPNRRIGIGSDHDFRNKVLLAFYTSILPQPNRLYYVDEPDWKTTVPDWLISHSQELEYEPPKQLVIPDVGTYRLEKEFRSAGISGWHWFLFRLQRNGP